MSPDRLSLLPPYVSTRKASRYVGGVFVVAAAISWTAAGYDLGEVRLVNSIRDGASLELAQRLAHGTAGEILSAAQIVAALVVACAFLPWLYQVRVNLRAFGVRRLHFRREWTWLGFLVPVLQLFRPCQVVNEVWRASTPSNDDPLAWKTQPPSALVLGWWSALLAWLTLSGASALLLSVATDLPRIQLAHGLALAGDVGAALSASLGYFVVVRISRAQDAKWMAFGSRPEAVAPALGRGGAPA